MSLVDLPRLRRWSVGLLPWILAAGVTGVLQFGIDSLRARALAPELSVSGSARMALFAGHLLVPFASLLAGVVASSVGALLATRVRLGMVLGSSSVVTLLIGWPLWRAGVELASGAWIAEQSFAPVVRVAPLLSGLVGAPILCALAFRGPVVERRSRIVVAGGLLGLAAMAMAIDHRVAPGLYPEFHMIAYAGATVVCIVGLRRAWDGGAGSVAKRSTAALAVLLAGLMIVAPFVWFSAGSRTRAELLLYSPVARDWIRTVMPQRRSTPLYAALDDLDVAEGTIANERADVPRGLIPAARDMNVLFVVVDAMRSDVIPPVRPAEGTPFSMPGDTPFLDEWVQGTFRFSRNYAGATVTHLSMPSLMRSIQPFEDGRSTGESLGTRLEQLGITPLAVVVEYFLASKYPEATALLDGFDDVVVYEKKDNDTLVPSAREMLQNTKGQRFFAWLHFYNLHDPGYDGKLLGGRDGTREQRYRSSVRWLDTQMRALVGMLDELGLRENTIVVLVADHGEGLGDHGQSLHGPTLFEHDVRVPLAIEIPGVRGVQIDDVVGNIDVIPTIVDLVGGAPGPEDRGVSLVPRMAAAAGLWQADDDDLGPRDYYFRNRVGDAVGVVFGADKLVLEWEIDVTYRFDVESDPRELSNLYAPDGPIDRDLMRRLITFNPELVKEELEDEAVSELLEQRLEEIDPAAPGAALPFLLRLAELDPTKDNATAVLRIFDDATSMDVRLMVLRHAYSMRRKAFETRVGAWIGEVADTPTELEIIAGLARQGQPAIGGHDILARLNHWAAEGGPAEWEPYLALVRPWKKSAKYFVEPFAEMLRRAREVGASERLLESLLENVASVRPEPGDDAAVLREPCRGLLLHEDPRVRVAALRAVAAIRDTESVPTLRTMLASKTEDIRVRREAATALAKLAGAEAVDDLVAVGDDSGLAMVVVRRLGAIGSPDALPWLEDVERKHYNRFLRRAATGAIAAIEKASGTAPKKKRKKPKKK